MYCYFYSVLLSQYKSKALHLACGEGHVEVVKVLLKHGADFERIDQVRSVVIATKIKFSYGGMWTDY